MGRSEEVLELLKDMVLFNQIKIANYCNVSPKTVSSWISRGSIPNNHLDKVRTFVYLKIAQLNEKIDN